MSFAFNIVRLNNTVLGGISTPRYERREEQSALGNDGQLHQTSAAVIRAAPRASWQTLAVRSLFTLFGTGDEVPHVAMDGTNGLELIGAKIATSGPGYASGTVHASRKGLLGDVYLSGLSWRPRSPVVASVDAYWRSANGATDPVTASTIALPTLAVNTEQLGLSSLLIGAADLTAKCAALDIAIDHRGENSVEPTCYNAGLPFPVVCVGAGINGRTEITATIDTEDLDTSFSNGAVSAVLRPYNHLAVGLHASQTATAAINGVLVREMEIPGEDGATAKRRLMIRGTFDGTNRPLTLATA